MNHCTAVQRYFFFIALFCKLFCVFFYFLNFFLKQGVNTHRAHPGSGPSIPVSAPTPPHCTPPEGGPGQHHTWGCCLRDHRAFFWNTPQRACQGPSRGGVPLFRKVPVAVCLACFFLHPRFAGNAPGAFLRIHGGLWVLGSMTANSKELVKGLQKLPLSPPL